MTLKEKQKAILEKLQSKNINIEADYLPVLMIVGYLTKLQELGIMTSEATTTPVGNDVLALCEEFDLKPTDKDIVAFTQAMVDNPQEQPEFACILMQYRDDREQLIKDIEKLKNGESPA